MTSRRINGTHIRSGKSSNAALIRGRSGPTTYLGAPLASTGRSLWNSHWRYFLSVKFGSFFLRILWIRDGKKLLNILSSQMDEKRQPNSVLAWKKNYTETALSFLFYSTDNWHTSVLYFSISNMIDLRCIDLCLR